MSKLMFPDEKTKTLACSSEDDCLTTYLVKITYDGSNFFGWSKQPKLRTVEGEISRILKRIFHFNIKIEGSSRTDTGVHAYEQYFTFVFKKNLSVTKMKTILQANFHEDIKILEVIIVDNEYDLRKNVLGKEYQYYINIGDNDPFRVNYEYQYGKKLYLSQLNQALTLFIGEHNFYNFSGLTKSDKKSPIRTIERIKVSENKQHIIISFIGRGFLRYQIRYLVAAAISYCENRFTLEQLQKYLQSATSGKFAYPKVPASGLYLVKTTLLF